MNMIGMKKNSLAMLSVAILMGCGVMFLASPVSASIIVSNLSQPQRSSGSIIGTGGGKAVAFVMASGSDYQIGDVTLAISDITNNPDVSLSLWTNDGSNTPGSLLSTFSLAAPLSAGLNVFTPDTPVMLSAGATYWVAAQPTTVAGSSYVWDASDTSNYISDIGASIGNKVWGSGSPSTWTNASGVTNYIQVETIPEPMTLTLLGVGGLACLTRRKRI